MNPWIGWGLVVVLFVAGSMSYGWQGALAALTVTVFWLLLQFNRTIRVMKNAAHAPIGHVASAVMLHSKLKPGLTMLQVVNLTRSLGGRVGENDDVWSWRDPGDAEVVLRFENGKLQTHELTRPGATAGNTVTATDWPGATA
jgi:hypothetical protein